MARLFSLLLLALLACPAAAAQAFGRFGNVELPTIAGMALDRQGFAAKHPRAEKIRFDSELKQWRPALLSPMGMTVLADEAAWTPSKIRYDLSAPGVSMYFTRGMRWKVPATAAPYLTWGEGSVTQGVPTPEVRWLVLSFRDDQPPVAIGFPDAAASLQIDGKPGAWTVQTRPDYKGWVRVGLPIGTVGQATNTAAALGRLARTMSAQARLWTQSPPQPVGLAIEFDALSVTASWKFDRPGAVVPIGATMAQLGGYPLTIASPTERTAIVTEEGPVDVLKEKELKIRFPIRRIPGGRGLATGNLEGAKLGTASPIDIPSVVELALENLTPMRDALSRRSAEETLAEYLTQASYAEERWTRQQVPYDAAGKGLDLAAAHALLMQSIASTDRPEQDPNALLTSVSWSQDWGMWLPVAAEGAVSRRAAALTAVAAALCADPEKRLVGATMQAGLSAQRGLDVWMRRTGRLAQERPRLEPLLELRQALFGLRGAPPSGSAFARALLSPVRLFGTDPVAVVQEGEGLTLRWSAIEPKPSIFRLFAEGPIQLNPIENLATLKVEKVGELFDVTYTPSLAGTCSARLTLPASITKLPEAALAPRYAEPMVGPGPR